MSTFTRTTTPPFSANSLQAFITYKQARRAAKGACPVALLLGALTAISLMLVVPTEQFADSSEPRKVAVLIISGTLIVGLLCLGWRMWMRPGPWKIAPILAFLVLEVVAEVFRFSVLRFVIVGVTLNFSVIAFRGALAMKRLQPHAQMQADLDVF